MGDSYSFIFPRLTSNDRKFICFVHCVFHINSMAVYSVAQYCVVSSWCIDIKPRVHFYTEIKLLQLCMLCHNIYCIFNYVVVETIPEL